MRGENIKPNPEDEPKTRGEGGSEWESLPPFLVGAIPLAVLVELLVGDCEVALQRALGGLGKEFSLQLLIAKVSSVLVGHVPIHEGLVGDRQDEFPRFIPGVHDTVGIIATTGLQLESDVLDDGISTHK